MITMRQSTVRRLSTAAHRDFFGINDITSKDVAGAFSSGTKLPSDKINKKYNPLMGHRERLVNEEKDTKFMFGRVRIDSDNLATKHGQFEPDKTEKLYSTIELKQMFVPDDTTTDIQQSELNHPDPMAEIDINSIPGMKPAYKISEVKPIAEIREVLQVFKNQGDEKKIALKYKNTPPLIFHFESYQEFSQSKETIQEFEPTPPPARTVLVVNSVKKEKKKPELKEQPDIRRPQVDIDEQAGPEGARAPMHELHELSIEYAKRQGELQQNQTTFDRSIDQKFDAPAETLKASKKAIHYIKEVREQKVTPAAKNLKQTMETSPHPFPLKPTIKLDSHGFRNYSFQVPDWTKVRRLDAIGYLRGSIIYNNYDILAFNKPYGLASHANSKAKQGEYDMDTLVAELAKSMRIERVYLAHRLDKNTTGILLFATSQERANNLNKLFKADEIKKKYLCITKGVPDPRHGIIDMPIGEIEVAGKLRSCPAPYDLDDKKQLSRKFREARRAITEYCVIEEKKHVALVELKPQSGVKHQLRCHLSFGLKTPILGDHKYSYLDRIAPQKLHSSVLTALHLRQTKVRTLPIHLHAKSIVIPGVKANGETLFINAPLPQHFIDNMKSLKLSIPA